jgi:hypothetical protein
MPVYAPFSAANYVALKHAGGTNLAAWLVERHIIPSATEDLKVGTFGYADAGQMHLYLNYARKHWMKEGENPPVGLILCAGKGAAEARYALDNLPNKVLAAEYQTVLPNEKLIVEELERSTQQLEERRLRPNNGGESRPSVKKSRSKPM